MIPVGKLGWMAGVIDLKGRIQYRNGSERLHRQISLIVDSKQFHVIRNLGAMTGTKPEMRSTKPPRDDYLRRGCKEHCPVAHVHIEPGYLDLQTAHWGVSGLAMVTVLWNLQDYLQVDRGYQEIVTEAIVNSNITSYGRGTGAMFRSLQRLKGLGWELPEPLALAVSNFDLASSLNGE